MRAIAVFFLVACGSDKANTSSKAVSSTDTCSVVVHHVPSGQPDSVYIMGDFNDWDPESHPLNLDDNGEWSADIEIDPGAYAYRFVEFTAWEQDGAKLDVCDPASTLAVCENITHWETDWKQECTLESDDCNSLLIVPECHRPTLTVSTVEHDNGILKVTGTVSDNTNSVQATLNDQTIDVSISGGLFHVEQTITEPGRYQVDLTALTAEGQRSEPIAVPIWTDEWDWNQAVIYHAMIDRVANGNPLNDATSGASSPTSEWAGGDLEGLTAALPYLDSLGVNTIWISNPQPAPDAAWPGDCDATYSGFHGFWPTATTGVDPRLGTVGDLDDFIESAHDSGMRVIMDWVGNHVHADHPQAAIDDQFHPQAVCKGTAANGQSNWDAIPESCWFTDYLPDWDHSQPTVIHEVVQTAVDWARDRKLDGLRVDAAKHMSHAVLFNLRSELQAALEHNGSSFDFNLIGETFDGADKINRYIGPHLLHGQFDFPLYWSLRSAFVDDSSPVSNVVWQAANTANTYPSGRMSTFLGNLDVGRFTTAFHERTESACDADGLRQAGQPGNPEAYSRLILAWTVLFTQPGMPMIYYGDEVGLPGYGDPDNRQALWWNGVDIKNTTVADVADSIDHDPSRVLKAVAALAAARAEHPALRTSNQIEWWDGGPGLYATAHTADGDQAIVVINRTANEQWLDNGIAFAGLDAQSWREVMTDQTITTDGDRLLFSIPPYTSQVWVPYQ